MGRQNGLECPTLMCSLCFYLFSDLMFNSLQFLRRTEHSTKSICYMLSCSNLSIKSYLNCLEFDMPYNRLGS